MSRLVVGSQPTSGVAIFPLRKRAWLLGGTTVVILRRPLSSLGKAAYVRLSLVFIDINISGGILGGAE
jgi:hypothetical protein